MNDVTISKRGIALIKEFEGAYTKLPDGSYKSYLDKIASPPVYTIYTGLTRGVTKDTVWTEEECETRLRRELTICEDAIERLVKVPLNSNQADALISFTFNCGTGALEKSTLLELLNQGKYETVPSQLARWCNAGGKKINGLARRRAAEGALFMEPMPEDTSVIVADDGEAMEAPRMPQRVEEAPAGTIKEVVSQSWTLRGAALALLGTITSGISQAYDWATGVIQGAGPEIVDLKQTISPLDPLVKLTPTVLYVVIIVGLAIVIVRKVGDHISGKAV